ncbi:hypothetical protein UlMin_000866 [Ulmus minor]
MDPEELSSLCSSLALEEDEEVLSPDLEAGLLAQGERSIDRSLVGCVLSTGPISRDAFVNMIKGVWKTKERFEVEAVGSNKFVFHFLSTADRRRFFSGGPWCYQNKPLVLEEPAGVGDYSKMSFSKAPFWIQLHNIPVFCMSKTVGSMLGNMVGLVQEVECDQNGLCLGTFIRVCAIIDISKPLKRILKVWLGSDKELVTILLRYEHLPELCFHCGIPGHPLKECPSRGSSQGDCTKLKYGAWIKAPAPSSGGTSSQSKRRRPSSGPSLPAPLHGNPTTQQPRKSTSKLNQSLHPNQQPDPQHHITSRSLLPLKKSLSNANWRRRDETSNSPCDPSSGISIPSPAKLHSSTTIYLSSSSTPFVASKSVSENNAAGNHAIEPGRDSPCPLQPAAAPTSSSQQYSSQMERVRSMLEYSGMLTWEREGRSSGLCLLWSDSITVQLLSGSKRHIDVMVTSLNSICWHFTGLYGNPDTSLRSQFWNLMKRLGDSSSLPWLCGGDLNEILFGHEKQGGAERAQYLMSHFREAINYCGLADLGFRAPKFTWNRGNGACLVQEQLDRMLGNRRWLDLFPNSLVHHLNLRGSDYRPLLVELLQADERSIIGKSWKRGRFHFEEAWADEEECSNIIKSHWNSSPTTNLIGVANKLRLCEERYWRQRSKDSWLKCGDRNSKFFHQRHLPINLKTLLPAWWILMRIGNYFGTLFSSSSPSSVDFDRVLDSIERKVTPQLNEQLEQVFEAEDVKTAVFQMAPTKIPGPDGMSAIFYQKFWPIVGEEVTAACLGFTNGGLSLGSINETIITLLPKIKNPTRITEFRPISLCNVLYKIISKMLGNRLRRIMGTIISKEQSTFIPGRLILDNAIIGFECLHAIKRRKTKKNYLALKLNMAKAYNRVEWDFIQRVMNKLGFSEVWIRKIMACISSVTYSFQCNGKRFGHLTPTRGLRQGDPLSPYLFLLCGEGLSSLLHLYEHKGDLQGLRCGLRGPTISHLLFADDSLFFLEARLSTCANLKEILKLYETASGQVVNLSKSAVCFGPNLSEPDATQMAALLGVPRVRCHEKYLGLPCFSGRNKQGLFSSIRDRVWNKL